MEENLQEKTENGSNSEKKDVLILAIESSCDETAAAVVKTEGQCCLILYHHR